MKSQPPVNPWTTLASRPIYDNPWISVARTRFLRPDGNPGIYGVVHFKNHAVGVLPVDKDGSIWMVGQYRYPLGHYSWEIPEGGGPADESPIDTASRELEEETGLVAANFELIAVSHLSNSVSDEKATIFRATGLTQGPSRPDGTERIEVKVMPWDQVWRMVRCGEITDSMTVIALFQEAIRRQQPWGELPPEV